MSEVDLFQANRPRLFGVAYRMLGSASDAEDVVQNAWHVRVQELFFQDGWLLVS